MKRLSLLFIAFLSVNTACAQLGSSASDSLAPNASETASSEVPTSEAAASATATESASPPTTVDLTQYTAVELPQLAPPSNGEEIAIMQTSEGTIKLRFFPEYAKKAVQNFKTHAKAGYYDGVIFHRVINEFMIQAGDPTGTGMGGESIWGQPFEMEITPQLHNIRGALSMARTNDPVSQGSQFFIVQNNKLDDKTREEMEKYKTIQNQVVSVAEDGTQIPMAQIFPETILDEYLSKGGVPALDLNYTVFGHVIEGMDVVDKIASVETSQDDETKDKPLADVVIEKITFENYNA